MGATVKNHYAKLMGINKEDLFVVSIVPCLAKKYEAARPEFIHDGIRDVDAVLTTTEMLEMMELADIKPSEVVPQEFDEPYKQVSGAGILFGASGGVAEAAFVWPLRNLQEKCSPTTLNLKKFRGFEGVKESTIDVNGTKVRVAVVSGLKMLNLSLKKYSTG